MIRRRRGAVPLIVERKHRRGLAAPSQPRSTRPRPNPDRRIRAWNADDHESHEIDAFNRKSKIERYQEMIAACVARHRRANDPDTWRRLGEMEVARYVAEQSMSHLQVIEGPDRRIVIRPVAAGMWADLKHAFFIQYTKAKKVVTDPKAPKRAVWWHFIKDMRNTAD